MTQAPTVVWNEIRVTSEGISISLISESPEGRAIVEDETWFTFDELELLSPSEPMSLNLTDESKEALSEMWQDATVGNLGDSRQSGQSENELEVGDVVRDENAPSWSHDDRVEVVEVLSNVTAEEYIIQGRENVGSAIEPREQMPWDKTVADANPSYSPDEPVILARYIDDPDSDEYAFPASRLSA